MSFFDMSYNGKKIDGSDENTVVQSFSIIPGGTQAPALIEKISLKTFVGDEFFEVTWSLLDGDYKGRLIFQKIRCFDKDEKKKFRAKNMLFRLYNICKITPPEHCPQENDFRVFKNKVAGIHIEAYETNDGKKGNWVSAIYPNDANFITKTGNHETNVMKPKQDMTNLFQANQVTQASKYPDEFDDKLPF